MKEIGRFNVGNEALDEVFDKEHKGTSVKDCVGGKLEVVGFVVYDNEGSYHLKFFAKSGKKAVEDFYTGSQVFIKDFMRLANSLELEEGDSFKITIAEGESKKGRKYLYIEEAPKREPRDVNGWRNVEW